MPDLALCPIHGKPGAVVFRCCLGARGGRSRSAKKVEASKRNAARATQARKDASSPGAH